MFKSIMDSLAKLNVLPGGKSWALKNVLNPSSGSQGHADCQLPLYDSNPTEDRLYTCGL